MFAERLSRWITVGGLMLAGALVGTAATSEGARAKRKESVAERPRAEEPEEQIDVGTRDVLERLKLLRVQMALDREEIEALRLRTEKIQLQREFDNLLAAGEGKEVETPRARRSVSPSTNILVKAISLQPRKEAIIMYRGRIFNVRPGDTVGNIKIKDITEGGLKIGRAGKGGSTVR